VSESRVVHLGSIFVCCVFMCTLALAADQKSPTKLSDLPFEAQKAISAAIKRDVPARTIQRFTLTASDGQDKDYFGMSVAIDGNTIIVGTEGLDRKEAYVFVKPKSGWQDMTQTAILSPSDGQNAAGFGSAVSISGNTIVVGALGETINGNHAQGAAYVFVKPATGWENMTETAKLTASDGVASSELGTGVAISGNTIVAGAPGGLTEGYGPGLLYVFTKPTGGWTNMTQTAELTTSNGYEYDDFGENVAVSANTILAAICGCSQLGTAYVFVEPSNGWTDMTQTATLTASDGEMADGFGASVSLSSDTAVVGSPGHNVSGAAYVFIEPEGGWTNATQNAELESTSSGISFSGDAVSIDGQVVVAGAPNSFHSDGAAPVFIEPKGGWQNTSSPNLTLGVSFTYGFDEFGSSVSVSGITAVVGAPDAPSSPPCKSRCQPGPGEAFVFTEQ